MTLRTGLILALLLLAPAAAGAERVKVRVGEHPGFDRLVFDWAKPVGVRLEPAPDGARLRFDRTGELDLSRVRRDPPPGVRGVAPEPGPEGLSVVVTFAPGAKPRLLENGASVVLDILHRGTPPDARPAKPAKAAAKDRAKTGPPPVPVTPVTQVPADSIATSPTSLTDAVTSPARRQGAGAGDAAEAPASPSGPRDKATAPLSLLKAPAGTGDATPERATPSEPEAAARVPSAASSAPPPPRAKPAQAAPKAPPAAEAAAKKAAKATAKETGGPARGRLLIVADPGPAGLESSDVNPFDGLARTMSSLRFKWESETAMAMFRRGPHLWLVFDRAAPGDVTEGLAELVPEMAPIEQFKAPGATLIRLTPPPIMAPRIVRDGTTWVVELWPRPPRPATAPAIGLEGERSPAEFTFAMQRPGRAVAFKDPDSGAAMVVVPALAAGQGLDVAHRLPQFRALRSVQGLALELADDALQVRVAGPGVRITHPSGLILSQGSSLATLRSNPRAPATGPRLFDFAAWRRAREGGFFTVRHALQAAVAEARPARRPSARLDLARFYFAHGLTSETVGLLSLAATVDPVLRVDPETRLIRGVAAFLSGDYGAASEDIFHPSLIGEAEAGLWNAAMAAIGFDWDVASKSFAEHADLIAAYPHRARMRLRLLAAEAELATGDLEAASAYLDDASGDDPNLDEASQIAVLSGYIHLQREEVPEARGLWRRIVQFSEHRPSQTRARLALLDLAVEERSVAAAEAIEELERLRFAWRGDHIELALLQRLGDLYFSQGRYRDSLRALRRATASVPGSRLARDVAQRMRDVFFAVIAGEAGESLAPLRALALYEEFKELTPPGAKGDRMLDRLADRLIEVDLLPRAAELLTTQVKYRLSGEAKAATGARVAKIRMLDDQPEQAITVLGLSEDAGLPEDLKRRRVYLRARALSRLSRYEEALQLIAGDDDPEALRLHADILWAQADWPAAAVVLTRLVSPEPRADRPLSEVESRNVADLAIALTLAGEPARLAALNVTYKDAMAAGPDRETFALLAEGLASEADRTIAEKLAAVGRAEDFMASYRDRKQQASGGTAN